MRSEAALTSDGCGREWWIAVVDQEEEVGSYGASFIEASKYDSSRLQQGSKAKHH